MALIKVRGHEFNAISIRDSFNRRALKFKNNIITSFRSIGLTEDDIEVDLEPVAIKRTGASASWYIDGHYLHFSYKAGTKYVENLYVVSKLIEIEVKEVVDGKKTIEQFIEDFSENKNIEKERKAARELLGVDSDTLDMAVISKKYKVLAKDLHPDMPNGNLEKFKKLNNAHKTLKRELE